MSERRERAGSRPLTCAPTARTSLWCSKRVARSATSVASASARSFGPRREGLREPREGQEGRRNILVLSRSCADLYEEVAELFADRPSIEVVVDRRWSGGGLAGIP